MDQAVKLHIAAVEHGNTTDSTFLAAATKLASDVAMAPTRLFAGFLRSGVRLAPVPIADASLSLLLAMLHQDDENSLGSPCSFQGNFGVRTSHLICRHLSASEFIADVCISIG